VLDRQRAGVDLLALVFGQAGCQGRPELLEGAPQPTGPPVELALVRQAREQVRPVAGHLGQERGFATPAQQQAHLGDRQDLRVGAAGYWPGPRRDDDGPGLDRVIDDGINVGEQLFG